MAVKSLISLSFVPEGEILERFFELADNFPPSDKVEEVITYFEVTYILGRNSVQGRGRVSPATLLRCGIILTLEETMCPRTESLLRATIMRCTLSFYPNIPPSGSFLKDCKESERDIALHLETIADDAVANNPRVMQKSSLYP